MTTTTRTQTISTYLSNLNREERAYAAAYAHWFGTTGNPSEAFVQAESRRGSVKRGRAATIAGQVRRLLETVPVEARATFNILVVSKTAAPASTQVWASALGEAEAAALEICRRDPAGARRVFISNEGPTTRWRAGQREYAVKRDGDALTIELVGCELFREF